MKLFRVPVEVTIKAAFEVEVSAHDLEEALDWIEDYEVDDIAKLESFLDNAVIAKLWTDRHSIEEE